MITNNVLYIAGAVIAGLAVIAFMLIFLRGRSSNWLANIFDWMRAVIESAETPFQKLAIFILPVLAPVGPATITGLHVYKLMTSVFDFGGYGAQISASLSVVIAVVLELIGYVGALAFIKSVHDLVNGKTWRLALSVILNGFVYVFYLYLMYQINYRLAVFFGTPETVNNIILWLAFMTVPSGILSANHLVQKDFAERDTIIRHEKDDFRLRLKAIENGFDIFGVGRGTQPAQPEPIRAGAYTPKPASHYHDKILSMLEKQYKSNGTVMELTDISAALKLNHAKSKGYISGLRKKWMNDNGIH